MLRKTLLGMLALGACVLPPFHTQLASAACALSYPAIYNSPIGGGSTVQATTAGCANNGVKHDIDYYDRGGKTYSAGWSDGHDYNIVNTAYRAPAGGGKYRHQGPGATLERTIDA
jgi:hypothetical protein